MLSRHVAGSSISGTINNPNLKSSWRHVPPFHPHHYHLSRAILLYWKMEVKKERAAGVGTSNLNCHLSPRPRGGGGLIIMGATAVVTCSLNPLCLPLRHPLPTALNILDTAFRQVGSFKQRRPVFTWRLRGEWWGLVCLDFTTTLAASDTSVCIILQNVKKTCLEIMCRGNK